jgi:hypothetical protein
VVDHILSRAAVTERRVTRQELMTPDEETPASK